MFVCCVFDDRYLSNMFAYPQLTAVAQAINSLVFFLIKVSYQFL